MAFSLCAGAQTITQQGAQIALQENTSLRGDQTLPHVSINSSGGFVVWQDNSIDGSGLGIVARWLDSTLGPGVYGSFRVNSIGVGEQERPQVATASNGSAVFVWQGGRSGAQNIYVRFMTTARTWTTHTDTRVNVYTNGTQTTPVIAAINDGKVVVAWSSSGQDGSMQGIYARLVNTNNTFATAPFQVNQFTNNNQRSPAVAVLSNGNFVVVWVSEQQRVWGAVDVMGRIYSDAGVAVTPEFRISTADIVCANPGVAKLASGGFTAVWSQKPAVTNGSTWDVYARTLNADGSPAGDAFQVNELPYGEQYAPNISSLGNNQLVVWTSLGQDGSGEGVFGRLLFTGVPSGSEFQINSTVRSKQIHPVVASDGTSRLLACWSGFVNATNGFDLFAQRYAAGQPLPTPSAPFVAALRSSQISVTWPPLTGYPLSCYEVYMDGAVPPSPTAVVTNGTGWVKSGLLASSTHTFRLGYLFTGGVRSQLSDVTSGTTWGEDIDGRGGVPDGLPDDWQAMYWGRKSDFWPGANEDSDHDGLSNYREFLAGTDPTDANSVLKMWFSRDRFGRRLNWSTQPGFVYQVQVSVDLSSWSDFGGPRFAPGSADASPITGSAGAEYYRVLRVR